MKIDLKNPPREFSVSPQKSVLHMDCGDIILEHGEQVTFVNARGKRHDFAAQSWGYYVTPSINARLRNEGFKTALVKNPQGRYYVLVVDIEELDAFNAYLHSEKSHLMEWLDERE